jgi:WD40 repeat protein
MIAHRSPVSGVDAWGGQYVATAGYDNQVILWDAAAKQALACSSHDHLANQCRFSRCGRFLVTASSDYTARLWAVPSLRLVSAFLDHEDDVEMASVDWDSERVATASRDNLARIFTLTGKLQAVLAGHTADVLSIEWIRGANEVVTSSDDGTVRRWNALSGAQIEVIDFGGVQTDALVVADDGSLFAGNDEGAIIHLSRGNRRSYSAHHAGIKRLCYDGATRRLVSASYDRTIRLWNVAPDGKLVCVRTAEVPSAVWLRSCSFAEPSQLVLATFGSSYGTFDFRTGEWDLTNVQETSGINAVKVIGDDVYHIGDSGRVFRSGQAGNELGSLCNFIGGWPGSVVTGGQLGTLFNAETGESLYQHRSPLNCSATFQQDGQEFLIVGAYTGEGLVFRRATNGLVLTRVVQLHDNAVKGISANSTHIFSVCATGEAAFHAVNDFSCTRRIAKAHRKISNGAATLDDGRFVSVSRDLSLRIWSAGDVYEVSTPHDHSVKCVAVSCDGTLVATGSYDGRVALYDWQHGVWPYNRKLTSAGISSLTSTSQARVFLASSYDGRIYEIAGS